MGKFFDENRWREILGLPLSEHPIIIPERAERTKLREQEDIQGMRELEAAAALATEAAKQDTEAQLRAALARANAQIAELKGEDATVVPGPQPPKPGEATPPAESVEEIPGAGDGPSENWTARQLRTYAESKGISLPKKLASASKRQILEHILENAPKE